MGPREVWRDLCRTMQGAVAFRRYLCSRETIDIALGLFEASSATVSLGQPCRYVIRVANISGQERDVSVTLQVALIAVQPVPALVRFTKRCTVLPGRSMVLECHYDWLTTAVFMIDNRASPPDESCQREIKTLQRYVVSAILSDLRGKRLDQLDIYQELQK